MTTIYINGDEYRLSIPGLRGRKTHHAIRLAVEQLGFDWASASVFIPHLPERGRYLEKCKGFAQLGANG